MVESVAWVTEMKNTESGLFFLCSTLFFAQWLSVKSSSAPSAGGGGLKYGLSLIFAALADRSRAMDFVFAAARCRRHSIYFVA
jgi:hypothetical protein